MLALSTMLLSATLLFPAQQGGGGPNSRFLGTSYLLVSPGLGQGTEFPGVFGVLRLDLATTIVVPLDENVLPARALLDGLGAVGQGLLFQVLRGDEQGLHLTSLRRVGEEPRLVLAQRYPEPAARVRVDELIVAVVGTQDAEGWPIVPRVIGVTPIFRPDVQGVAYFEYEMNPGGFVVVATGEHDVPVPNWSSVGRSPSRALRIAAAQQSRTVARVLRIDSMAYAAEDAAGERVALRGELPLQLHDVPARTATALPGITPRSRPWPSWRALKAGFADTYNPHLAQLHDEASARWVADGGLLAADWSSWTTYCADGDDDEQPRYDQFTYGSCYVGCGPVAWAMLFGWGDRQAHAGSTYWSGRTGLYRTNGGGSSASTSAIAPLSMDDGIKNVIRELNDLMGTYCLAGSGATNPWDMDLAAGYLSGRTSTTLDTSYNSLTFAEDRLREAARDSIRDRDTPAVIGNSMGGAKHYPVAFRYRWRSKDTWLGTKYDREFYVNPGWGSSSEFQWVDAKAWFCGQIYP